MAEKTIRVVMLDRKWAVIRTGEEKPLSVHDQRQDAVDLAQTVADRDGLEVIVFDLGGRPLVQGQNGVSP